MKLRPLKIAEGTAGVIRVRCKVTGASMTWNNAVLGNWQVDEEAQQGRS